MDVSHKKTRKIMAIILNISIVIMEIIGLCLMENLNYEYFLYYTQDSNIIALIISLLFVISLIIKTKNEKFRNIMIKLRYFSTCYLILTFLVVLFILNAQMEDKGFLLFHREMLFLHFLCPIVSFISLIWFDVKTINNFSLSMKDSLISMTFTLLYGITLIILNITKVYTGPYPFFEVYKNPPIMSVVWFIVIIFGAFLISLAIKELINSITWTKWVRKRHKIITTIAFFILYPIVKKKYGINIERCKDKRQFMILLNHQTVFDQFFVGMTFRRAIYYLATEDIFSNGFSSKLIEYAVAPIPIKKSTSDLQAVKTILRVAKEGGTIAIAPEGNRTYSGKTIFMKPSITRLVKIAKLPLVLYHIEGGYGIQPRWSDDIRKGKMTSRIYKIIEPEEYMKLSDDELYKLIVDGLMVDETLIKDEYHSKTNAEYIERVIYYCPRCGLSSFISKGDTIKCEHCALEVKYLPNKTFISQEKEYNFPYENVMSGMKHKNDYIMKINIKMIMAIQKINIFIMI